MKAVVTGATGFVGKWLVNELLEQGYYVCAIVRNSLKTPQNWSKSVQIIESDLSRLAELEDVDEADVFFHLAWTGTSGVERANEKIQLANVQYTIDAVRLANRMKCKRFINAGSIMEYEASLCMNDASISPSLGYIYSTAKLTADYMARTVAQSLGVEYLNAIISNIYGVGETSARFLNTTLRKLIAGDTIEMTEGLQLYDFIYVSDAVKQMVLLSRDGQPNHNYYIGNSQQRKLREFVLEMKEIVGSRSLIKFGAIKFDGPMLSYSEFDTKAMMKLGFSPQYIFADGVRKTYNWMRGQEDE